MKRIYNTIFFNFDSCVITHLVKSGWSSISTLFQDGVPLGSYADAGLMFDIESEWIGLHSKNGFFSAPWAQTELNTFGLDGSKNNNVYRNNN